MIFSAETLKTLEWFAAGLGVINIALLIFRSQWNFAFAIASVSLYVFIFFESRLYAESGLQVFFILANVWGWFIWRRSLDASEDESRVAVRWLDWRSRVVWLTVSSRRSGVPNHCVSRKSKGNPIESPVANSAPMPPVIESSK